MESVEGRAVGAKPLALLETGETAVFAAYPRYATVFVGRHWDNALLLLTDRRFLIVRDRFIGADTS